LIGSIVMLVPVLADDSHAPVTPDEAVYEAVAAIPGMNEVVTVEIIEADFGDGPSDMLTVIYLTQEVSELGYRLEMLDVYRVIADVVKQEEMSVDSVVLVPSITADSAIEIVSADLNAVLELNNGDVTRTEFVDEMQITPGAHQTVPEDESSGV